MARRRKRKKNNRKNSFLNSVISRIFRGVLAVLILTAFVLGIAYSVKGVATFDTDKLASLTAPYLKKVGINEAQVGMVAGKLIERVTDVGIEGELIEKEVSKDSLPEKKMDEPSVASDDVPLGEISSASTKRESVFSVAIIADSHIANDKSEYIENKTYLESSLNTISTFEVSNLIHVGDITNWGVVTDLKVAKEIMDSSGISYYSLPGDRDLAQAVGPSNFNSVFGKANETFNLGSFKFVLFDNSANYTPIDKEAIEWFAQEVENADFVILSQPLNTEGLALFNCQYMGSTCSDLEDEILSKKQSAVHDQRDMLLDIVRKSSVSAVIAGDHHKSSSVVDEFRADLTHYMVGAVGGTVSEYSQSSLQTQRFSLLKLFDDGSFVLDDVVLD